MSAWTSQWILIVASIIDPLFGPRMRVILAVGETTPRGPQPRTGNDDLTTGNSHSHHHHPLPAVPHPHWTYNWSLTGELTWNQSQCIKIPENLTLCRGAGYSRMHLPNLLDQDNIREVNELASSWMPLLSTRCNRDTQIFLCSLIAPVCHVRPIWPCRKLCQSVQTSCEGVMQRTAGVSWPPVLHCDRFTSDAHNGLCIGNLRRKRSKVGRRCSVCDQPDTLEGIVDHFCRVDTAIRLNIDQLLMSATSLDVKIVGSKLSTVKSQKTQSSVNLLEIPITVDAGTKCSCTPLWNRSTILLRQGNETRYLVMGMIRNDRLRVSFLQPFNASSPVMIRAMSVVRKDAACTTGIKHLLQQSTKSKKKSKKKENKQKAKTKKKEVRQKQKAARKDSSAPENVNATKNPQHQPLQKKRKQKASEDKNNHQSDDQNLTPKYRQT